MDAEVAGWDMGPTVHSMEERRTGHNSTGLNVSILIVLFCRAGERKMNEIAAVSPITSKRITLISSYCVL